MIVDMANKEEILKAPLGATLGTIIEIIEEENLEGATMIIQFLDENQNGYQFNLNGKKIEPKKEEGFIARLRRRL